MTDLEIPDTGAVFTFGKSRFADNKPSHFFIKNDPVVQISCGDEHTAVICENGRVFCFGTNDWGQLGLGHNNMVHKPSCVKSLKPEKAKLIACGRAHTLILTETNSLYSCGSNSEGQLGLGNVEMANVPTIVNCEEIKAAGNIRKIAAGSNHSMVLAENGQVFIWGGNSEGQLGLDNNKPASKIPQMLEFGEKIVDISCGYYHTAIVTDAGVLYTFGENDNGKLGLGKADKYITKPTRVQTDEAISGIICGGNHTFATTYDGKTVCFGSNINGELGFSKDTAWLSEPTILPHELFRGEKVRRIACGESHTAFLTDQNQVYTCGDSRHGKLCHGHEDEEETESHAGEEVQFIPRKVGRFEGYEIVDVACGGCHSIVCARRVERTEGMDEKSLPPLQRVPASMSTDPDSSSTTTVINNNNNTIEELEIIETDETMPKKEEGGMFQQEKEAVLEGVKGMVDDVNELVQEVKEEGAKMLDEVKGDMSAIGMKTIAGMKSTFGGKLNSFRDRFEAGKGEGEGEPQDGEMEREEMEGSQGADSGTASAKSDIKIVEEPEMVKIIAPPHDKDDNDIKTEKPVQIVQSENRITKFFNNFRRKKISESKSMDHNIDNIIGETMVTVNNVVSSNGSRKSQLCVLL